MEQIRSTYIEYTTESLSNSNAIRSLFKSKLYTREFLDKFTNYILEKFQNKQIYISRDIDYDNQQIKLSIMFHNQPYDNNRVYLEPNALAPIPNNYIELTNEDLYWLNNTLFTLDYGDLLRHFIIQCNLNEILAIMPKEHYDYFMAHKETIGEYLITKFQFSDSRYSSNNNLGLKELNSVMICL